MRQHHYHEGLYEALPPVSAIATPNLTDSESVEFLDSINAVRSGEKQFFVLLTNHKVLKADGGYAHGPKRVPERDYDPHPALKPHAHMGWMSKAPTNDRGEVYVYVFDAARAQAGEKGHTNVTMEGIHSFKVLNERPGPLAKPEPVRLERKPEPVAPQPEPVDYKPLMVQAMALYAQSASLQAQATALMAQALMAYQQQPQPSAPA